MCVWTSSFGIPLTASIRYSLFCLDVLFVGMNTVLVQVHMYHYWHERLTVTFLTCFPITSSFIFTRNSSFQTNFEYEICFKTAFIHSSFYLIIRPPWNLTGMQIWHFWFILAKFQWNSYPNDQHEPCRSFSVVNILKYVNQIKENSEYTLELILSISPIFINVIE